MRVRPADDADLDHIDRIHTAAFASPTESHIVRSLRDRGKLTVSLMIECSGEAIGHLAMSPVQVDGSSATILAIGPIAVIPERQRQGVGSELMREGINRSRRGGVAAIILLGDPAWYRRFGFKPASMYGLRCRWTDGPAFQVLVLDPDAISNVTGEVRYDACFDDAD